MDIFDKMCFTISSAGGRRGAQMGTFDVGHPDVMEFIRAKRENGRLRQFNLSLLITDEFMQAVREDREWKLAFPLSLREYEADKPDLKDPAKFVWREWPVHEGYVVNDEGLVACKVYKTLPARRVWDVIMTSTYDFAEPGFILIDRVNEMNNNWWCENIRATNPCVTADTRLATRYGLVRIGDLYDARVDIQATVDKRALGEGMGVTVREALPAFMTSPSADVYRVVTKDGYEIKATEWHDFYTTRGKIRLKDLKVGDELLVQSGKGQFGGCGSEELGALLGLITGDGHFTGREGKNSAVVNLWGEDRDYAQEVVTYINSLITGWAKMRRQYHGSSVAGAASERVVKRREAGERLLPDSRGGVKAYACKADYELIIDGESRERFMSDIGFMTHGKSEKYEKWVATKLLRKTQRFVSRVAEITHVGKEAVFDTTQADHNTVIFNGLVTGQCGEQPLPPYGSCLLGSVNLTRFVKHPFTDFAEFDWSEYREVVKVFTRMLDNVVEVNGLPLEKQREEILRKRRHGMGFLGLGSTLALLRMKYGSPEAVQFTEDVTREMAVAGWEAALELAREKGPAPIMNEEFTVTKEMLRKRPEMARDGWKPGAKIAGRLLHAKYSRYMQRVAQVAPQLVHELAETGARFTHHTSIAPTGTISLSLANNASNGIEPSFAHHYFRNVIREGKKS